MKNMLHASLLLSCLGMSIPLLSDSRNTSDCDQRQIEQATLNSVKDQGLSTNDNPRANQNSAPCNNSNCETYNVSQLQRKGGVLVDSLSLAEQRRNKDAKRKQGLLAERISLSQYIEQLKEDLRKEYLNLAKAKYHATRKNLNHKINELNENLDKSKARLAFLDREINRSLEHDSREIARKNQEAKNHLA